LIHMVTALEALRWPVKNSDAPRTLLEASMLRFALNEHFINVDTLLAQLNAQGGRPTPKKKIADPPAAPAAPASEAKPSQGASPPPQDRPGINMDIEAVRADWDMILQAVTEALGPGTGGLLAGTVPKQLVNDTLTIRFEAHAGISKEMCESSDRAEEIARVIGTYLHGPLRVVFETAAADQGTPEPSSMPETGLTREKRNELLNDPAVKTVLLGLNATVTGIEPSKSDG